MKAVYLKKIIAPNKSLKIIFFFFLLFFGSNIFGQVSNYTFAQTSGTYTEISGGTILGTATASNYSTSALCDVVYSVTSLPFSFNFDGSSYTAFSVSTNGFITFGSTAPSTTNYNPLSSGETYNGAVAAWGGDLSGFVNIGGRTSQIRWQVTGSSPNREVVIQWKNIRPVATSIDFNVPYLSFQIRLKETSNIIECVYGPSGMATGVPNSNAAQQVGLRGPNNTFPANINNRSNTTTVSINSSSAGTANNSEQRFSSVNATPGRHADGKIYRWTPGAATPTISSTVTTLTSFTTCSGSASSTQNFSVSGANMAAGITITPPVGFEVSTSSTFGSSVGTNASPLTIGAAGTIASTTIYVRLLNTASGTPSGNITLTSTNSSTQNVSVSGTVNSSSVAPVSISGTTTICSGSTTLSAQGGSLGTGAGYQWYAGGCGSGAVLGTNSSLTVSPTSNTTYYLRISGTCNTTSCVNTTVTVNSSSTAPISISGTTTICSGNSTTLSVSGGSLGTGAGYEWYAGGCGTGTVLGTGSSLTVSPSSNTTYYVRISGTCNTTTCASTTVTVNSSSTAPVSISGTTTICSGSTTLSAQGGSLGTGAGYQWYAGGCGSGTVLGTSSSLTVSPTSNTTYYLRISGTCNTTSCVSTTVTVNSSSTAPVSISGTTTICSGNSTTLSVSGGSLGTGAGYEWYAGGCGTGTVLGTGSSLTVTPGSNTTYYVRISGTCNTTTCASTTVTVNSSSTMPSSISGTTTICSGSSTTLAAQGGSLGTGAGYQWYAGGCESGTVLGTGSSLTVSPSSNTTYYLRISGTCNTTSCVSTTVSVNSSSTAPASISGTTTICSGNSTTLSASGGALGAGASYQWYAGGCGSGSSLGSGSSISVSPTSNTSYFVRISGTCNTTSCVNQTVSVTNAPSAGTLSGNQTICPNGSTTFTTNGNIGGIWTSSNLSVATVNSSGSINGVTAGTATITYSVSGSGGCNSATATRNVTVSDITLTSNTNSGDFVWNGSTSNSWTNLSNWSVYNGVSIVNASIFPTQLDNVVLPMNNTCVVFQPTINATNDTIKSLKIESGATFTMSNSTLVVSGNWVQNGSFIPGNGNVIFKGSGVQYISGVGTILFSNVSINNSSSGINLQTPVEISTSLTMINGNISTSALNSLTLGIGSVGTLNWTNGTIIGPFKRWFTNTANTGNSSGLFPVGTASDNRWAMLEYTSAPASAGYISAEFKAVNPSATSAGINGLPLIDQYNWSINNIATDGYWEIIPITATGGTYNLKLRPKAFSLSNLYDVGRIIKSPNDHSTWVLNGNHGSTNGSQSDFNISRIGMTGFSYFAIGYTNNAPLPVKLISFQANCLEDNTSILSWSTASENNSSYFQLEKSRDGINWYILSEIAAAGNSTTKIYYEFFDLEKFSGVSYYRLKQFDFDGKSEILDIASNNCGNSDISESIKIYPNPSIETFYIDFNNVTKEKNLSITIIDLTGKLIYYDVKDCVKGNNKIQIKDLNATPGVYFIEVKIGESVSRLKHHFLF